MKYETLNPKGKREQKKRKKLGIKGFLRFF
jgi:hypothetical protein